MTNEEVINKQAVIDLIVANHIELNGVNVIMYTPFYKDILQLPPAMPHPEIGHCKDCKWWKDRDGVYRRGNGAESQCPINRVTVYEGNGYCYMFAPQKSEKSEDK